MSCAFTRGETNQSACPRGATPTSGCVAVMTSPCVVSSRITARDPPSHAGLTLSLDEIRPNFRAGPNHFLRKRPIFAEAPYFLRKRPIFCGSALFFAEAIEEALAALLPHLHEADLARRLDVVLVQRED